MTDLNHSRKTRLGLHDAGRVFSVVPLVALCWIAFSMSSAWAQGADTVFRVQQLQEEVRELRGQVEQQAAEIERLKQQQRDQYLDLDNRINELADGVAPSVERPVDEVTAGDESAVVTDESSATATGLPELDEGPSEPATVSTMDAPETRVEQPVTTESDDDKAQYDAAFQHLRDLRYAQAAEAFSDFLEDYPNSEFADNAQYWLGESYYVTGNYDLALDAFDRLLDDFPSSPKTADALLKIGYTQYELENWSQARTALEAVKREYPDTTLARLADNRLRAMRLEGHY